MRPQQRFNVVVHLLFSLVHSKYGICSFVGDLHGRLDLELVPTLFFLFYSPTNVRLRGLASAFYRRCSLPTFRAYRRNMAFPNHVKVFHRLVPTSPYAIGDDMDAFRLISLRFSRGISSFVCWC